jgi:hypothetical protein
MLRQACFLIYFSHHRKYQNQTNSDARMSKTFPITSSSFRNNIKVPRHAHFPQSTARSYQNMKLMPQKTLDVILIDNIRKPAAVPNRLYLPKASFKMYQSELPQIHWPATISSLKLPASSLSRCDYHATSKTLPGRALQPCARRRKE